MRKLNFVQTRQSPIQSQSLFCTNPRQFLCPFQQKADPKGTYIHYDTFYNYRILQAVCQAKNERFLFFPFFSRFSQSQPLFCPKYRKKYRNSPAPFPIFRTGPHRYPTDWHPFFISLSENQSPENFSRKNPGRLSPSGKWLR